MRAIVSLLLISAVSASVWPAPNHNSQNTRRHSLPGPNSLPVPFCSITTGSSVASYVVAPNNVLLINLVGTGVAAYHSCQQRWLYRTTIVNPSVNDNIYMSPDDSMVFIRAMDNAKTWKVVAVRVSDGTLAWSFKSGPYTQLVGMVVNALLVQVNTLPNPTVVALNVVDGTELWSKELSTGGSSVSIIGVAPPTGYPFSFIAAGINQGNVTAFSAKGEVVWTSLVPFQNAWVAAFATDVIVIPGDSGIVAIHLDGSPAWACTVCTGTQSAKNFAITNDRVISTQWSAIASSNWVLALDLKTGVQLWQYRLTNYVQSDPVLVLDSKNRLYVLWPQYSSGLMITSLTWDVNNNRVSPLFENLSVHGVNGVSDVALGENEMYAYQSGNPNVIYQLKPFG